MNNLLLRIHFLIKTIWWTNLAPWEFGLNFPGSLISTSLHTKTFLFSVSHSTHILEILFCFSSSFLNTAPLLDRDADPPKKSLGTNASYRLENIMSLLP